MRIFLVVANRTTRLPATLGRQRICVPCLCANRRRPVPLEGRLHKPTNAAGSPLSVPYYPSEPRKSAASMTGKSGGMAMGNSMCGSRSLAGSIPGAISVMASPRSVKRNTARSVM